jgi:hypothetical protein
MIIKPPDCTRPPGKSLFLAGSIEMGNAIDWQTQIGESFPEVTVYNPRREDWDPAWAQKLDNPQFRWQVEWELSRLENADFIIMNFEPGTYSPISLMELGLYSTHPMVVRCPEGFWRKGNVDIVCRRWGIPIVDTYAQLAFEAKIRLEL